MKVLITGGSEGIGRAFAEYYAAHGAHVLLVARHMEKLMDVKLQLEQKYNTEVEVFPCDLMQESAVESLYQQADGDSWDVLINNAGMGYTGFVVDMDSSTVRHMIQLNVQALTELCYRYARGHVHSGGIIVNVSSTGCYQEGPYIAEYYATKAYVTSYSRALAKELLTYGIHVCCLCPGPTDTDFYEKSGGKLPFFSMSPEKTVQICMKQMNRKTVIVPRVWNRLMLWVPRWIRVKVLMNMKKKQC